MNYKLAKQLKDKGFPQKGIFYWVKGKKEPILINFIALDKRIAKDVVCVDPTLSELIEALGEKVGFELFEEFSENNRNFKAVVNYPKLEMARGKTPQEAVAKLWLKLNE